MCGRELYAAQQLLIKQLEITTIFWQKHVHTRTKTKPPPQIQTPNAFTPTFTLKICRSLCMCVSHRVPMCVTPPPPLQLSLLRCPSCKSTSFIATLHISFLGTWVCVHAQVYRRQASTRLAGLEEAAEGRTASYQREILHLQKLLRERQEAEERLLQSKR